MARFELPSISVSRRGSTGAGPDRTVVWVCGDHDMTTESSLAAAIAEAARLDGGDLLIDLSGVTFMDASTIGAIVRSANRLRSSTQSLQVGALSSPARRVLELCGPAFFSSLTSKAAVHPTGPGAALGTWIEVSSADASEPMVGVPIGPVRTAPAEPSEADAHHAEATATVQAARGRP